MGQTNNRVEPYTLYHSMLLDSNSGSRSYHHEVDPNSSFAGVVGADHVICIAGVQPIWDGVGYAWVRFSPDAHDYKLWLYRNIRIRLEYLVDRYKFWRVQGTVACDHMAGCSWIESLGFEFESTLVKYGPSKEDHYMYRKFYEV
tara:strand:- start:2831 stop:3262 length:432 start_codon:yes stop_codon:yes gene_type:complete